MPPFLFKKIFLAGLIGLALGAPLTARAASCSDRKQVRLAYCEKQYHNAPRCLGKCDELLAECRATGCWNSTVTAKRCGFSPN